MAGLTRLRKRATVFDYVDGFEEAYRRGAKGWTEDKVKQYASEMAKTSWYLDHVMEKLRKTGMAQPEKHREKIIEVGAQTFENLIRLAHAKDRFARLAGTYRNTTIPKILNALKGIRRGRQKAEKNE
ncbi:hypothetical protein HY994_05455 [Candidatus Micrarchaeota archaeon]|nr:hypothetical protein [Candidatus Micrarchaeota archaeon]